MKPRAAAPCRADRPALASLHPRDVRPRSRSTSFDGAFVTPCSNRVESLANGRVRSAASFAVLLRRLSTTGRVLLSFAIATLLASPATAQPDDDASETFRLARDTYDRGEHDAALRLFRQAYASSGSPVALLYVARSLRALGRPTEAADEYTRTIGVADASTRERDERVRQTALAELEDLTRGLGTLRLVRRSDDGVLRVDERVVPRSSRQTFETPGTHVVSIEGAPCERWETTVTLEAGRETVVEVPCDSVAPVDPPRERVVEPESGPSRVPAGLTFALGGALAVAGTTLQLVAGSVHADLREACRIGCPADARSRVDHGRRLERTSIAVFATAGVSIALGILLWWLGDDDGPPRELALSF